MKWIRITETGNIPPREGRAIEAGKGLPAEPLAIFNLGDRFVAIENRCPHSGGPLADGIVGGTTVTCPLHNWRICLDSGRVSQPCDGAASSVRTFPVRVDEGVLLVGISETAR